MYTPPINAMNAHVVMPSMTKQMSHTSLNSSFDHQNAQPSNDQSAHSLTAQQEQYFNNVQMHYNNMEQQQHKHQQQPLQYVRPKKKNKKMRRHRKISSDIGASAYQSDASRATSVVSPESLKKEDDSSIIGSFTSMAFGYIM